MGNETHQSSLWSGGLIAASFIFLQGFLSKSSLDFTNLISIFAFAFAIPILTCNILVNFARRKTNEKASIREILFYSAGIIASLIGIAAAFCQVPESLHTKIGVNKGESEGDVPQQTDSVSDTLDSHEAAFDCKN